MNIDKYLENNIIFIIPNNIKKKLIKYINNKSKMYDIKILTLNEFKKSYFFDYNEKTIKYLMDNYNLNFKTAEEYINNIYNVLEPSKTKKINYLLQIKENLEINNLIIKDIYFKETLKRKKIYFYGFTYIDKYLSKIINDLRKENFNVSVILNNDNNYEHEVISFNSLNDEIEFVVNDIISKDLDLNKVYLANVNKDNENTILRVFNNYNIKINFKNSSTLFDTEIGKSFLNNIFNYQKELNNIKDQEIKNIIINILNKYYWTNITEIKNIIIEEFKAAKLPSQKYNNAINIIDLKDNIIDDDEYIYLLNFNREYIPKIYKDTDFINDKEKPKYLETTNEKNINEVSSWQTIIKNIKNLTITYSNQNLSGILNPSSLIDDLNLKVINKEYIESTYSNKSNIYNLGILLDNYSKSHLETKPLEHLYLTYPDNNYLTYNNKFNIIKLSNYSYKLSYSKMNTFFECPFKYYCDNVLKLTPYEDTYDTWLGSICHYILSEMYKEGFDFNKSKEEFINNNPITLTEENKVFLDKVLNELKDAIPHIKSLNNISKYQEVECEKLIQTTVDDIPFVGIVDKIMHYKNNIVIIDYKTGTPDVDLRLAKYGLNLQLPTYAYLIKTLYPNSNIVGIYLEHILKPNINYDLNKSEQNQYENHLKLQGYSIDNEDLISELDPTYLNSDYIKGMKMTSNGFAHTAKLLNKDNFEKLKDITEEKIKECIKEINQGNFQIKPKINGFKNLSCAFCPYKSVCYVKEDDKEFVTLDNDLTFLGGENND